MTGPSLKVVDALGVDAGYLLSIPSVLGTYVVVFNVELGLALPLNIRNGGPHEEPPTAVISRLYFKTSDCTGDPYLYGYYSPYSLIMRLYSDPEEYYRVSSLDDLEKIGHLGSSLDDFNQCTPYNFNGNISKLTQIPRPGFTGPLSIVER